MRPYIYRDLCSICLECIDLCPYDVFTDEEGEVKVINPEDCIECMSCVEQCPTKAIFMDD
ncbi:MAG: ferredoxin family protein [Syntrophorhabdus sp.]